jgi:hypothetical protein
VSDALAMRTWLLDSSGGGLATGDLRLLVSTSAQGAKPPGEIVSGEATVRDFIKALGELDKLPSTQDDRLFVYFAGHGCQTDPTNQALSEDAIVFSDFNEYQPQAGCVGVSALQRRLSAMRYGEFFVFVDACRDFPYARSFQLGGFGFDTAQEKERAYYPRAHVFQATLPGGVARGASTGSGAVAGLFTKWLLDGLRGKDEAKTFNPTTATPRYEVTWDRLRSWVEHQMPEQPPRARAEGNPVLSQFDDGWFSDIELQVNVGPQALRTRSDLEVLIEFDSLADPDAGRVSTTGPTPFSRLVPPRRQRIFARAPGLPWGRQIVDAYVNTVVELTVPDQPSPPSDLVFGGGVTVRGIGKPRQAWLRLSAQDPAAVIELVDLGGRRIAAVASVLDKVLPAGSYVARVHVPGFPPEEHPVELEGGVAEARELPVGPGHDVEAWTGSGRPASTVASARWLAVRLTQYGIRSETVATLSVQHSHGSPPWRVMPEGPRIPYPGSGGMETLLFVAGPGDTLQVAGRTVQVPVYPAIHTSVAVPDDAPVVVRLVDGRLVGTVDALLLERAQGFEEAGQPEFGQVLLDQLARREVKSDVASVLRTGSNLTPRQQAISSSLARSSPGADMLPGQIWRVTTSLSND